MNDSVLEPNETVSPVFTIWNFQLLGQYFASPSLHFAVPITTAFGHSFIISGNAPEWSVSTWFATTYSIFEGSTISLIRPITSSFPAIVSQTTEKSLSISTLNLLLGRFFICPTDASTKYSFPKYLLIVLAFAGDSTIMRDFSMRPVFQ